MVDRLTDDNITSGDFNKITLSLPRGMCARNFIKDTQTFLNASDVRKMILKMNPARYRFKSPIDCVKCGVLGCGVVIRDLQADVNEDGEVFVNPAEMLRCAKIAKCN